MKAIRVRTQFPAFHRWVEAPAPVHFLRNWHRHMFKVRATLEVDHANRQLEFFIAQRAVEDIADVYKDTCFEYSCERLAELFYEALEKRPAYKGRVLEVVISEDGENDGIFKPEK